MTGVQFEREKNYGAGVAVARMMLSKGIITEKEYRKIDTILRQKHRPIIGTIFAKNA